MLRTGLETLFTGNAGTAAYLLIAVSVSFLFVIRAFGSRGAANRDRLRLLCAGILLTAVSRILFMYLLERMSSWPFALSLIPAIAGLYLMLTSIERAPVPRSAVACFAAASVLAGCMHFGALRPEPFWRQLLVLIDLSGFLLMCASVFGPADHPAPAGEESSPVDVEPPPERRASYIGDINILRNVRDIGTDILNNASPVNIYGEIVTAVRRSLAVDLVVLRMAKRGSDYYKAVASAGDGDGGDLLRASHSLTGESLRFLRREDRSCGAGYLLGREDLGAEHDPLIGPSIDWKGGRVFVLPIERDDEVRGFFALGFFETAPTHQMHDVLDLFANLTCHALQRERERETIIEKERALAACREDLEEVNQLKTNFISIVSHELRTPLTSVKAYAETLSDNIESVERKTIKDFLRVMNEESERLIKMVDSILNYSCMETGLLKVEKTSCNLNEMIEEALESLRKMFLEKKVNHDLRVPKHSVVIDADRELVQQLFQNLLGNAVKFTPPGGSVTVVLEEEAAAARIVVQDTGKGIPEDQLEKIFERFHQADASNTREFGGSGLGLAICKNIVDWHDGQIWVENVKDAGAKFVVLLPMNNVVVRQSASTGAISSVRFARERYLALLIEMLSEVLNARKASIMLLDPEQQVLRIIAAKGLDPEFVENTRLEVGERIAGRVVQAGESLQVFDIERDVEWARANNSMYYGTHSFICVPLKNEEGAIGVLNVSDHVDGREFTKADRELLEALAAVISGMLKKLEAYEKVSSNFANLKEAMRRILEIRETWGSRTLTNLTLLALDVGRRLDLDEKSLTALRLGMNLYDLGMMMVPRSIRGKKEQLSSKEWRTLHGHPAAGYALLSPMGLEERIMKMVRCHHENFDGSGYPAGLAGAEIPIEARIVNVIDAFRALITPGPYRRCYSLDEARNEIIRGSGTKFDPKVVSAFVKSLHGLGAVEDSCEIVLTAVEQEAGVDSAAPAIEREDLESPPEDRTVEPDEDDDIHMEVLLKEESP